MKKRLDSITRVLDAQRQLHRAAEWQLARLQRQEAELEEDQRSLIAALNDDNALQGLFIEATAKRMRAVARKIDATKEAKAQQAREVAAQASRVKRAERLAETVEREHRRDEERRDLAEVIEQALAHRRASLP
jgi:hypothetical protein